MPILILFLCVVFYLAIAVGVFKYVIRHQDLLREKDIVIGNIEPDDFLLFGILWPIMILVLIGFIIIASEKGKKNG